MGQVKTKIICKSTVRILNMNQKWHLQNHLKGDFKNLNFSENSF